MRFISSVLVAAAALATCASAGMSVHGNSLLLAHNNVMKRQNNLGDTANLLTQTPNDPISCAAAIDKAVQFLDTSQGSSDTSKPPDFSQAEIGLAKLTQLLNHCIDIINDAQPFSDEESQAIGNSLLDMRQRIVTITDRIKASKPNSDKYGYTGFLIKILQMLTSQMYKLEQAVMAKATGETKEKLPAILVDIVCVMSGTIKYLGGESPIDEGFCNTFGGQGCTKWEEYKPCGDKRMPPVPLCKPMEQCNNCAPSAMKWMYENNAWNQHSGFCQNNVPPKPKLSWSPPQLWWDKCKQQHQSPPSYYKPKPYQPPTPVFGQPCHPQCGQYGQPPCHPDCEQPKPQPQPQPCHPQCGQDSYPACHPSCEQQKESYGHTYDEPPSHH